MSNKHEPEWALVAAAVMAMMIIALLVLEIPIIKSRDEFYENIRAESSLNDKVEVTDR